VTSSTSFDLQAHSTCSDGTLAPAEVVQRAHDAGVRLLALTDHDTVDGVDEALAAGERLGVQVVPASEISSVHEELQDLHILGYGIDHASPELRERLADYRSDRERRAWAMADKLVELGYAVDRSVLEERAASGKPIGRPHLAGAVVNHPDNASRLAEEGLSELTPFLVAYLIEGKPAFVGRSRPTVQEAIELIHSVGGVAVWAHPFWDVEEPERVLELLDLFVSWGLDGVEAFYVTHTPEQIQLLARRAEELELLSTGSADYHGPKHKLFAAFRSFETHGLEPALGPIVEMGALSGER
jgi:predicted metal-dependent phosphoesterase TrpH